MAAKGRGKVNFLILILQSSLTMGRPATVRARATSRYMTMLEKYQHKKASQAKNSRITNMWGRSDFISLNFSFCSSSVFLFS